MLVLHLHRCFDKPWISGIPLYKQYRYKPVTKCNYRTVLGYFKNWNILQLSQKSTPSDAFDGIHQVFIDEISDNMDSLFESVNMVTLTQLIQKLMDFILSWVHPRLEVNAVPYFQAIPKSVYNRMQEKNHIKIGYIFDWF